MKHLSIVFIVLKEQKLVVQEKKCGFGLEEVEFLGFKVNAAGIATDEKEVKAVMRLSQPQNVTDVRAFLGIIGFYRKFISGFAELSVPLSQLLKKDQPFTWDAKEHQAFNSLKKALTMALVLTGPNFAYEFAVTTDTSGSAIGNVISQEINGKTSPSPLNRGS